MKVGRVFSIFACLLISLQICGAVICPSGKDKSKTNRKLVGSKECADACGYVQCGTATPGGGPMEYWGCQDVMQNCRLYGRNDYFKNEFEFISQHNPNALMFKNNSFTYISGCGNEKEGYDCVEKMMRDFFAEEKPQEGVFWHSSYDGVKGNGNTNSGDASGDNKKGNGNGSSASNSQNGAFKFVGIIAIVWILVSAWIH